MSVLRLFFGVVIPYGAVAIFIVVLSYRLWRWARVPVPFRIPTTCGQQKSLPWIKPNNIESPYNNTGVAGRMILEVLLFRSLFRDTKSVLKQGAQRIIYGGSKYLWLGALALHWCLLVILLRHLRIFTEPVPSFVLTLQRLDGIFELPSALFITDLLILSALTFLLLRRVFNSQIRYISLPADYLALLLILGVVISGIFMKFSYRVDVVSVKELALGMLSFNPSVPPEGIGLPFYVHLFFVSSLLAYFPFSKLVHMAGICLSPTRNLANTNRMSRHVNPWSYPVEEHSYDEWEDEFRDVMKDAGLPLEKE
jgi:nitrate reductase gamma subunit